jgi:acetoacetate decarboxylase
MPYPTAPWNLQGYAVQTLNLIDTNRIRNLIPQEFEIVSVLPGKTVGGVYLSKYQPGSVLEYNELIVVPGLVKYQNQIGGWVSHIYVDNPDSVAGGREIWGLPKEMADFTWLLDKQIVVKQEDKILCSLEYNRQSLFAWRQWFGWSSFSTQKENVLSFPFEFEFKLGFINSKLVVPSESPLAILNFGSPLLTMRCDELDLKVDAPAIVGQRKLNYSCH